MTSISLISSVMIALSKDICASMAAMTTSAVKMASAFAISSRSSKLWLFLLSTCSVCALDRKTSSCEREMVPTFSTSMALKRLSASRATRIDRRWRLLTNSECSSAMSFRASSPCASAAGSPSGAASTGTRRGLLPLRPLLPSSTRHALRALRA